MDKCPLGKMQACFSQVFDFLLSFFSSRLSSFYFKVSLFYGSSIGVNISALGQIFTVLLSNPCNLHLTLGLFGIIRIFILVVFTVFPLPQKYCIMYCLFFEYNWYIFGTHFMHSRCLHI